MYNGAIFHDESREFYPQTSRKHCRSGLKKKNICTGGKGVGWNINIMNDMLVAFKLTAAVTTCMRPLRLSPSISCHGAGGTHRPPLLPEKLYT